MLVAVRIALTSNFKSCVQSRRTSQDATFPLFKSEEWDFTEKHTLLKEMPGVTRILAATKPAEVVLKLLAWKQKMIKQLGEERFEQMRQDHLNGTPLGDVEVLQEAELLWSSVLPLLKDVTDVKQIEEKVFHPVLGYSGYVDCIAKFRGQWCIVDWKTSQKPRRNLEDCYDDPLQVAAYAGAFNFNNPITDQIKHGLIVKIYHDGSPAAAFDLNTFAMEYYWNKWLKRVIQYSDCLNTPEDCSIPTGNLSEVAKEIYGLK